MADTDGSTDAVTKLATTVAALAAAFVAQRAVGVAWRTVTGREPDLDPDDSPIGEIVVFAAVSAAMVAVAKTWAQRKAKAYVGKSATQTAS